MFLKFSNKLSRSLKGRCFNRKVYKNLNSQYRPSMSPYAFIRVCNEDKTLRAMLESIEGILTKGVIGYNDCTDLSVEIIQDFCRRNTGFIAVPYGEVVYPANDARYKDKSVCIGPHSLATYYNVVLSHIPDGEWFIKIDGDHIYDREKLRQLLCLPERDNDCVIMGRINLIYCNDALYYKRGEVAVNPRDHWLVRKKPQMKFVMDCGYDRHHRFYAWELLPLIGYRFIHTELMNWHFPWQKNLRMEQITKSSLGEFSELKSELLKTGIHFSDDMVDESHIKGFMKGLKSVYKEL